jgi:hypothetical protein
VWFQKGVAFNKLGENQEAIKCLKKFVEFAPPQYALKVEQDEELIIQLAPYD